MAFSVNSVGHMVKSAILSKGMIELNKELGLSGEGWDPTKVDSLERALGLAMKTISLASDAVSGRATRLLPIPRDDNNEPIAKCPFHLPPDVAESVWSEYRGLYHTDVTVPSEYFVPDVSRPQGLNEYNLDFTYLYDKDARNPDHITIGEGRRIRKEDQEAYRFFEPQSELSKFRRMEPESVTIDDHERLKRSLGS